MATKSSAYMAYLVRLWSENHDDKAVWRASLELPGHNKQMAFPTFEALIEHLKGEMTQANREE
ncbi:MAG: hypothetical protein AAF629_37460 [Chloroflexota bacterium]